MESYFINMYVEDKEELIKKTKEEIENSNSEEHTLAKKIKLSIIKWICYNFKYRGKNGKI